MIVEVDGSHHMQKDHMEKDKKRDAHLARHGLDVLRFDSRQVLCETDAVVEIIFQTMEKRLKLEKSP